MYVTSGCMKNFVLIRLAESIRSVPIYCIVYVNPSLLFFVSMIILCC